MKMKVTILFILGLLSAPLWPPFAVMEARAGASAEATQAVYDFGSVEEGTAVFHDFVIQNLGCCPLLIRRIETDEGLTAVISAMTVSPRRRGLLTTTLDTHGRGKGDVIKKVRITTSDPRQPVIVFTLRGHVSDGTGSATEL